MRRWGSEMGKMGLALAFPWLSKEENWILSSSTMPLWAPPPYSTHSSWTKKHLVSFSWLFFFPSFLGSGFNYHLALGKCAAPSFSRVGWQEGLSTWRELPTLLGCYSDMPTQEEGLVRASLRFETPRTAGCQLVVREGQYSRQHCSGLGYTLHKVTSCIFEVWDQYYLLQQSRFGRQMAFSLEFALQESRIMISAWIMACLV